jgi:hypothetical protein
MFKYYSSRLKRGSSRGYREPEQPFVDESAPYVDYQEDYQQQDYQQDYQQRDLEQMPPPQSTEQLDPMPVVDQGMYEEVGLPAVAPLAGPNIFEQPNLLGGLAPATIAAPLGTTFPGMPPIGLGPTYATPVTSYPQAGSMSVGGMGALYPTTYTQSMAAQQPAYGAYGQYTTTSMRMG